MSKRTVINKKSKTNGSNEIEKDTRVSSNSILVEARAPQVENLESMNLPSEVNSNNVVGINSGLEPESKSRDLEIPINNKLVVSTQYRNPNYEMSDDEDMVDYYDEGYDNKGNKIADYWQPNVSSTIAPTIVEKRIVHQDIPDVEHSDDEEAIPNYILPFIDEDECVSNKRVKHVILFEALAFMQSKGIGHEWLSCYAPDDYYPMKGESFEQIMRKINLHRNLRKLKSWKRFNNQYENKAYESALIRMHNTPYSQVHVVEQEVEYVIHNQMRAVQEEQNALMENKRKRLIYVDPSIDSGRSDQPAFRHNVKLNKIVDQFGIRLDSHRNAIPMQTPLGNRSSASAFEPGMDVTASGQKIGTNPYYLNEINNNVPQTMVQVLNTRDLSRMIIMGAFTTDQMIKVLKFLREELNQGRPPNLLAHFGCETRRLIMSDLVSSRQIPIEELHEELFWVDSHERPLSYILQLLENFYKKIPHSLIVNKVVAYRTAIDTAASKWVFNSSIATFDSTLINPLNDMYINLGDCTPDEFKEISSYFFSKLKSFKPSKQAVVLIENLRKYFAENISKLTDSPTFIHLITAMKAYAFQMREAQATNEALGLTVNLGGSDRRPSTQSSNQGASNRGNQKNNSKHKGGNSKDNSSSNSKDKGPTIYSSPCDHCGSNRHKVVDCRMSYHPDYNPDPNIRWKDTNSYRRLKDKNPQDSDSWYLKRWFDIAGKAIPKGSDANQPERSKNKSNNEHKYKGNFTLYNLSDNNIFSNDDDDIYLLDTQLMTGDFCLKIHALIDSGAIHANYCSEEVAAWINKCQEQGSSLHNCKLDIISSNVSSTSMLANTDISIISNSIVSCNFIFNNELTNKFEQLSCLKFKVIKTNYDVIIGLPAIRKFRLAKKLTSVFEGRNVVEPRLKQVASVAGRNFLSEPSSCDKQICNSCDTICFDCAKDNLGSIISSTSSSCSLRNSEEYYTFVSKRVVPRSDDYKEPRRVLNSLCQLSTDSRVDICCCIGRDTMEQAPKYYDKPSTIHRRELLGDPIKDDEIVDKAHPIDNLNKEELSSTDLLDLITFEGSPILQSNLRKLCEEFRDIFSTTVREKPANLPTMTFEINSQEWKHKRNRLPARIHGPEKQAEILKQIEMLLNLGIIEISQASEWSQVHMVPKPASPGEWRITIDFVKLNQCTLAMEGWPITIISALFQRLGAKKHTVFGILDMTSGYFQGPLAKECRAFTAFITLFGLYQWTRVPMGLMGSGSYFQRSISSTVLAGLIYDICELYIDDVLISGETEDSFLVNVRAVFQRFRQYKVVIHPKKAKLGLPKLEYVGHLIDSQGLHFSREKRLEVLAFPKPTTQRHVHMFLGLANYFRNHVEHITELLAPLRDMIEQYEKHKKVVWTVEREAAFEKAKQAVYDCQKLFFVNPTATPILQTDASDYGIGGMLYQIVNGIMQPIMYLSKALQGSQYNWSVIEKECYAIFFCIQKLKPIIGNSHFILKTDHKNLVFIKDHDKNCKVTRWKYSLMEENFSIEYVPGTEYNQLVPDALSRLVEDKRTPGQKSKSLNETQPVDNLNLIMKNEAIHIPNKYYAQIKSFHNTYVGHFAPARLYERMQAAGELKDMPNPKKWIKAFVKQCVCCQLLERLKLRIKIRPFTTSSLRPFQLISMDHIGPIRFEGLVFYILVIIDCFSRWVELYETKSTTALDTAECLFNFYGRYGAAETISSDRGPAFHNDLIQQLVELGGSDYQFTTAYSHEENAIVERQNAEVMRHLRSIIFDARVVYSIKNYLPIVQRILNTVEKSTTGVTPAEMLFGNNLRLNTKVFDAKLVSKDSKLHDSNFKLTDYMDEMLKQQETILTVARQHQLMRDTYHMQEHDSDYAEYPINSYVLYTPPEGKQREKSRMTHDGPLQVINRIGDIYTVQNLVSGKPFDTHISALRPFHFDPIRVNPKEVAIQNAQEFHIDRILSHRGDSNKRSSMEFMVRWLGYSEEYDTWEPYNNLRDTDQLITYLKDNKLKKLIGLKHKV